MQSESMRIAILQPFSGARAPLHGQPNMCATEGAPGVPSSMVVEYIHSVSAVPSIRFAQTQARMKLIAALD